MIENPQHIRNKADKSFENYVSWAKEIKEPFVEELGNGLWKILNTEMLKDSGSKNWCLLPYKLSSVNNKRGCPNFGSEKRPVLGFSEELKDRIIRECSPNPNTAEDIFDFSKPITAIAVSYPVGLSVEKIRIENPNLKTEEQLYNFRYWQDNARYKFLYPVVKDYLLNNPGTIVDLSPEAHGIDLRRLFFHIGEKLEFGKWPPTHSRDNIVYLVAIGGYPK
jgi:hypothetical protein